MMEKTAFKDADSQTQFCFLPAKWLWTSHRAPWNLGHPLKIWEVIQMSRGLRKAGGILRQESELRTTHPTPTKSQRPGPTHFHSPDQTACGPLPAAHQPSGRPGQSPSLLSYWWLQDCRGWHEWSAPRHRMSDFHYCNQSLQARPHLETCKGRGSHDFTITQRLGERDEEKLGMHKAPTQTRQLSSSRTFGGAIKGQEGLRTVHAMCWFSSVGQGST